LTQIYLAVSGNRLVNQKTFDQWDWEAKPLNLLVSFLFLQAWGETWKPQRTILDSGAFSAWTKGQVVDIDKLCEEAGSGKWDEAVALDVIGDGEKGLENALYMKDKGLTVMPVFHYGEPWSILQAYRDGFGRIGLSGGPAKGIPLDVHFAWLDQCFARLYPAKFHAFGATHRKILMRYPFYSADSSSWMVSVRFGRASLGDSGMKLPRKSEANDEVFDLRFEVLKFLDFQEELKDRWRKEFINVGLCT